MTPTRTAAATAAERETLRHDIEAEVALTREEIGTTALDERVMAAMATVPRERFVPDARRGLAYANGPLPIGRGQTISQPYIVALMTHLLRPRPDSVVLEVGTGSGYQAAVLAQVVRHVYTVEIVEVLAHDATARLAELGYANVTVRHGDGALGWPEHAPFDGIVVTAAAPQIPVALLSQLAVGARLVMPVGEPWGVQVLQVAEKLADGTCGLRDVLRVAFVPLTGAAA